MALSVEELGRENREKISHVSVIVRDEIETLSLLGELLTISLRRSCFVKLKRAKHGHSSIKT